MSWKTYKAAKGQDAPISFEAQLVNAMVNTAAPIKGRLKYSYSGEGATRRCKVVGKERETGEELEYETPEIGKIKVKNSPLWQNDPDQQLGYFAARSWARRHFPEMLLGVYARDEIDEARGPDRARDVTPQDYQPLAEKLKAMQQPQEPQSAPETAEEPEPQAEVEEAEVVGPDASQGAPGSAEYDEGVRAFQNGAAYEDNPHEGTAADDWAAGFAGAQRAAADGDLFGAE